MSSYNTAALRQLLLNALPPDEFEALCYDHFKPAWQRFSNGQSHTQRVQDLIEFVERYGLTEQLIELVRQVNEMQHLRFRDELTADAIPPIRADADDQTQIELLLVKTRDIIAMLERQQKRYGSSFVPARFLLELEQRRADVQRLEEQLNTLKQRQTVGRRGARPGTDIPKQSEDD